MQALRAHWPEYLIEAWALGTFMVSAGLVGVLLGYPGSPLHQALPDPIMRRVIAGVAMGSTAIALIYSRWGQRSGAHMNPAVTLSFLRLGKVRRWDAFFYVAAQFVGGVLGVLLVAAICRAAFTEPPVAYVTTRPGPAGAGIAFLAELVISAGMMLTILVASGSRRFAPYTGLFAGLLVATYIAIEEPFSGMSMNPARSFASAAPAMMWEGLWIYMVAPLAGMLLGTLIHRGDAHCAKLQHPEDVRCIHCGYEP
jgi:aquaporin Z